MDLVYAPRQRLYALMIVSRRFSALAPTRSSSALRAFMPGVRIIPSTALIFVKRACPMAQPDFADARFCDEGVFFFMSESYDNSGSLAAAKEPSVSKRHRVRGEYHGKSRDTNEPGTGPSLT